MQGIMLQDEKLNWIKFLPPGTEFQTRRIIKPSILKKYIGFAICERMRDFGGQAEEEIYDSLMIDWEEYAQETDSALTADAIILKRELLKLPKYKKGFIIYVKEKWRVSSWDPNDFKFNIEFSDGEEKLVSYPDEKDPDGKKFNQLWMESSEDTEKAGIKVYADGDMFWEKGESPCRWRNKMQMPESFARTFLDVADVRIEWLGEISEADAKLEGIQLPRNTVSMWDGIYREGYIKMWESIHKPGSWERDKEKYVWVYVLRRKK